MRRVEPHQTTTSPPSALSIVYHYRRAKYSIEAPESRGPRDILQVLQIEHGRRDRKGRGICCRQGCPHADIQGK